MSTELHCLKQFLLFTMVILPPAGRMYNGATAPCWLDVQSIFSIYHIIIIFLMRSWQYYAEPLGALKKFN